jgi:zinc-ribbon domain
MALITCSECGREVSDKAAACVGCGAPLARPSGMLLVPDRPKGPPPTTAQIQRRALLALAMLVGGIFWAATLQQRPDAVRSTAVLPSILIVGGLCWILVLIVHAIAARR